jgi:hypothetical protein
LHHALAGAYEATGQVKEAVQLLEQVVKIEGMTLGRITLIGWFLKGG